MPDQENRAIHKGGPHVWCRAVRNRVDEASEEGVSHAPPCRGDRRGCCANADDARSAPAALAADQQVNHFRDVFTDVDPDFCGTGQQIDIAVDVRGTEWLAPHQADYKNVVTGTVTFTNPLTGDTVINHFANAFWDETVSGDPEGLHVHEFTTKGLPELFKTPHGGVLTLDAGYIVFQVTFDGDEEISSEIVVNNGPHPQADSDFELFCEIMPEALGL